MNPRAVAAKILKQILVENQLWEPSHVKHEQAPLIRHFCFSVLRHYYFLDELLKQCIQKPLKPKDTDIKALLMIGLFELCQKSNKPHAIVDESVKATLDLKKNWAKGFLNGTLRQFIREGESTLKQITAETAQYNHPKWILKKLKKQWPESWQTICEQNNQHAPMVLRVNQRHLQRDDYLNRLNNNGIQASTLDQGPQAILLEKPMDVEALPGFDQGDVSVQDLSAQRAASLLELSSGLYVLDACAAPGGKSAHILESTEVNLTAVEVNPHRFEKLKSTLSRLKLKATLHVGDASAPHTWWDGQTLFDRIVLDAPCTGSGVIRRHPDIKVRLSEQNLQSARELQNQLLTQLWPLLKPQGILLYCTCSIFKEENTEQIEAFLKHTPDASHLPLEVSFGIEQPFGIQQLPDYTHDGFYYAKLIKS